MANNDGYIGTDEQTAAPIAESKMHWATAARLAREAAATVSEGVSADVSLSPHASEPAAAATTDSRQTYIDEVARIRGMRAPFGGFTQKLAIAQRSGYHRHWFNDMPGRVDEALMAGWAHIVGKDGQPIKRVVGSGRDKGAMYAFAMEIPSVFWEEDMARRHEQATAKIDAIKSSPVRSRPGEAKASDSGKFYSPQEDILSITKG